MHRCNASIGASFVRCIAPTGIARQASSNARFDDDITPIAGLSPTAQATCLLRQLTEVLGLGDLGNLLRFLNLIYLDL
jgi:hypothetical protein